MLLRRKEAAPLLRISILLVLATILASCDEAPSDAGGPEPAGKTDVGFEAVVTGAYEGQVSGVGTLVLLPEAGFEKRGYFFLADGRGVRPHGVTFVLPPGIAPGRHELQSPSPLRIGTVPSVRVDRDMGDSVLSSDRNTSGFLHLIAFPADPGGASGSDARGRFEFETEDPSGRRIAVKGSFSFEVD
jgi:hypothetical protein